MVTFVENDEVSARAQHRISANSAAVQRLDAGDLDVGQRSELLLLAPLDHSVVQSEGIELGACLIDDFGSMRDDQRAAAVVVLSDLGKDDSLAGPGRHYY